MVITLGVASSASCSTCTAGKFAGFGQRVCSSCKPGTYATNEGATSSAACSIVLQIFQFKAPYLLSEVTGDIQSRMSMAVANILGVNARNVVLTLVSSNRRDQQPGVLVSAGITDFQGSAASYASKVTQSILTTEMTALGLNSGQLVSITGVKHLPHLIIYFNAIYINYTHISLLHLETHW